MKGRPKFGVGDEVTFTIKDVTRQGTIYIVDPYGTFEDESDVSYDIMVLEDNTLYKHIREDYIDDDN